MLKFEISYFWDKYISILSFKGVSINCPKSYFTGTLSFRRLLTFGTNRKCRYKFKFVEEAVFLYYYENFLEQWIFRALIFYQAKFTVEKSDRLSVLLFNAKIFRASTLHILNYAFWICDVLTLAVCAVTRLIRRKYSPRKINLDSKKTFFILSWTLFFLGILKARRLYWEKCPFFKFSDCKSLNKRVKTFFSDSILRSYIFWEKANGPFLNLWMRFGHCRERRAR